MYPLIQAHMRGQAVRKEMRITAGPKRNHLPETSSHYATPFGKMERDFKRMFISETGKRLTKEEILSNDILAPVNRELLECSVTTPFQTSLDLLLQTVSSRPLPVHICHDADAKTKPSTAWVPRMGEIVSTRTETTGMAQRNQVMKILEDVVLGSRAGTEDAGEKLVGIQVDPDVEEIHVHSLSPEITMTAFGTWAFGTSLHNLEVTLQVRKNTGGDETFQGVPYLSIRVEYRRNIIVPPGHKIKVTARNEWEYYKTAEELMPRLVRKMSPAYWSRHNRVSILEAHIPRTMELPEPELQVINFVNEMPVSWILASMHKSVLEGSIQLGRLYRKYPIVDSNSEEPNGRARKRRKRRKLGRAYK